MTVAAERHAHPKHLRWRGTTAAAFALARAGFRRWATYRQAAVAGIFVNTVFGVIKLSILLGVADSAGGTVAGYDKVALSTYAWVTQGLIGVVMIFAWTELADRVRTGDIAVDLARPIDLQLSWLAADLGRALWGLMSRAVVPILFGAALFGFRLPTDAVSIVLLPLSIALAVAVSFACRFLVNLSAFWIVEVRGPGAGLRPDLRDARRPPDPSSALPPVVAGAGICHAIPVDRAVAGGPGHWIGHRLAGRRSRGGAARVGLRLVGRRPAHARSRHETAGRARWLNRPSAVPTLR